MLLFVDAVEIRNRMRSVDDLMYYGRWKRESLSARRRNGHNVDRSGVAGSGSVSLDQSYTSASTLSTTAVTDDEGRPGSTQRRRRSLRLRRRSAHSRGSIVSAPTHRPINLDDSVGSGALDVDSMLRFFASSTATPVADDGIRSPAVKPSLPPSGLPPSGAAGRTTSARRTFQRRRRRPKITDVMNDSADIVPSSFDDVQMTSSNVDLRDATSMVFSPAAAELESTGVERSRPVRRSRRRRRRTSESPSPAAEQDLADTAAPVMSTSTEPTDITNVTKPEALWELCGEKLKEVCQRILDVGVPDTVHDVVTEATSPAGVSEFLNREAEVVQPSHVVERSPPDDFPVSNSRRVKDSADLHTNRLSIIPDVIPDVDQPISQSLVFRDVTEDNCNGVENIKVTDVGSSDVGLDDHSDEFSEHKPTLPTTVADHDNVVTETAVNHVPSLNGEHDVEQFQTATYSSVHGRDRLEPEEETVSDQPSNSDGNRVVDVSDDDKTLNVVDERSVLPGLDISIMLSPSIELQDILDTIYTLTSGVKGENRMTEEDGTPSPPPRGESPISGDEERGCLEAEDNYQQHLGDVEQLAAVCPDGAEDDDDDDSSLNLDAEMYDIDLSPAAADFADSVHLAIAEDEDDLDIEDTEYDLDDDEVL